MLRPGAGGGDKGREQDAVSRAGHRSGQGKGLGEPPWQGESPGSRDCGSTTGPRPDRTSPRPLILARSGPVPPLNQSPRAAVASRRLRAA